MRFILVITLMFINPLYANPEKGKAAIDLFLQDQQIKNLTEARYQAGTDYISQMKYEKETEKHATWQQNQSINPANLEQIGATQAMQEMVG